MLIKGRQQVNIISEYIQIESKPVSPAQKRAKVVRKQSLSARQGLCQDWRQERGGESHHSEPVRQVVQAGK